MDLDYDEDFKTNPWMIHYLLHHWAMYPGRYSKFQNERWLKYELLMWVEKLAIIIWFWIPVIDVERYIGFLYANMMILINILKFKL